MQGLGLKLFNFVWEVWAVVFLFPGDDCKSCLHPNRNLQGAAHLVTIYKVPQDSVPIILRPAPI